MKRVISVFAALFLGVVFTTVAQAEVIFICHKNVPVHILTPKEIKHIFLARKTTWSNSEGIIFANHEDKTVFREFSKKFLSMSPAHYTTYFRKKIFTGMGQRPKAVKNDQKMIEFVSNTNGAIGYISTHSKITNSNVRQIVIK